MMLVDCETCPVRGRHCADCMVTALTLLPMPARQPAGEAGVAPEGSLPLDPAERRAVSVLIAAGLVDRAEGDSATARFEPTGERVGRAAV